MSDSLQPCGLQPTILLRPWDFPGRSTGVGCHCLLHKFIQIRNLTQSDFVVKYKGSVFAVLVPVLSAFSGAIAQRKGWHFWKNSHHRSKEATTVGFSSAFLTEGLQAFP